MHCNIQQNQSNQPSQQQQLNLSDFQSASSQEIIVEFARTSYPLVGALIDGNLINGEFGYGEIQQPRNQRLVMLQGDKLKLIEQVSKIIITKSTLKKKNHQQQNIQVNKEFNENLHQNQQEKQQRPLQNQLQPQVVQQEQRFFSESSKSSDQQQRQERQAKNMLKKRSLIKKSSQQQKTSKINKNILKKKLKYLTTKK